MQLKATPKGERIELTKPEIKRIDSALETLRLLCRLAPPEGYAVDNAVRHVEAVRASIDVDGVYTEPESN